ncbi:nitric oxide reductase activation protein NorD [Mycobacterium neumannii]|uniref:nitric oxide reductase activation protein NorD n=1 Tax=Mycobacterium neumannii TaxID=2048551 RepID=UPI003AB80C3E
MNASGAAELDRFRFLATFIAGRPVDLAAAPQGQPAHTNGTVIFVTGNGPAEQNRREVMLHSALIGAGSLQEPLIRPLRARPTLARRYLAIEGHRVLAELARRMPLAAALQPENPHGSASAAESLEIARSRTRVSDPPIWFGILKPSALLSTAESGARASDDDLRFTLDPAVGPMTDDDDDEGPSEESKILKMFDNPLFNSKTVGDFLRKLLGTSGSSGNSAGGDPQAEAVRRVRAAGSHARPLPTKIHFTGDERPGAAVGVGGALHPEWDVFGRRYRPDWCRVIDYPLTTPAEVAAAAVTPDDVLRRRLSRIGLGPRVLRRRPDGDELDIEALVDLSVDLRSGFSPPEHIFSEHRKVARNLGVLILLDASGSVTDADPDGLAVHEHQRRAAATLAATLEELGDRVAVYAFRSRGRHAVHLPAVKKFDQRFGAVCRARLNQLQPSNYTRLGAAIRGAAEILEQEAGTPNKLLLVLSDGHPYDDGYEGRYAEADAHKALEELRADGIACLCLSIGSSADADALDRVFGSVSHAGAASLAELSPRIDELFMASLRELAAPAPRRHA